MRQVLSHEKGHLVEGNSHFQVDAFGGSWESYFKQAIGFTKKVVSGAEKAMLVVKGVVNQVDKMASSSNKLGMGPGGSQ